MRVVLDTNVVVSALVWGGVPYLLLQAAVDGDIELCTSLVLLAELREVLARGHLASRLAKKHASVDEAIALYGELAITVSPLAVPRVVPNDADDDHVIAAALAANAQLIVSGDKHLLDMERYQSIRIVRPRAAARLILIAAG